MSRDSKPTGPAAAGGEGSEAGTGMTRRASVAALAVAVAGLIPHRAARAQPSAAAGPDLPTASESHRRTPAASITSVHGKLRHLVMADEDYGFVAGAPAAANARALQRAVDDAQVVTLPDSVDVAEFSSAVRIRPFTTLIGAGPARTRLRATGGRGLVYEAPAGAEIQGPRFEEFALVAAADGIKLNDAAAGFGDRASQSTIMRPRFQRVFLAGPGAGTAGSVGLELNKCFSTVVDQCEIFGFETGLLSRGGDFLRVVNGTRIVTCGRLIDLYRQGTKGSGAIIDGADLLVPTISFIRSGDQDLTVRDCYLEHAGAALTGPALDIDHIYAVRIVGNRLELPAGACPILLRVIGEGQLFVFRENKHGGEAWGRVDWNDNNSARYALTTERRQQIVVANNAVAIAVPFTTAEPEPELNRRRDLWSIGPGTAGFLLNYNYNQQCRVQDGAFVLPPGRGSLVRFRDGSRPASGLLSVYILARSDVAGTRIGVDALSGETGGAPAMLSLSAEYQWHAAFEGIERDDLALDIANQGTGGRGRAFIRQVVVERAFARGGREQGF